MSDISPRRIAPAQPAIQSAQPAIATTPTPAIAAPLVAMLNQMSRPGMAELERALRLSLTPLFTRAEFRVSELGELAEMLDEIEVLPWDEAPRLQLNEYDSKRLSIAPSGEWLSRRYDSWEKACRAAYGLKADGRFTGPGKPWPSAHGKKRPSYIPAQVPIAITRCALALGRRPSSADYHRWATATRLTARQSGVKRPLPPTLRTLYRFYPAYQGGFQAAVADAALNDNDIRAARAVRLLGLQEGDYHHGDTLDALLSDFNSDELEEEGFTPEEQTLLSSEGAIWLPLSRAVGLARLLRVSLDRLAAASSQPGTPPDEDARFDGAGFGERRRQTKVSEARVLEALEIPLGAYRRLLSGADEPTLGELTVLASLVKATVAGLVARPDLGGTPG